MYLLNFTFWQLCLSVSKSLLQEHCSQLASEQLFLHKNLCMYYYDLVSLMPSPFSVVVLIHIQ